MKKVFLYIIFLVVFPCSAKAVDILNAITSQCDYKTLTSFYLDMTKNPFKDDKTLAEVYEKLKSQRVENLLQAKSPGGMSISLSSGHKVITYIIDIREDFFKGNVTYRIATSVGPAECSLDDSIILQTAHSMIDIVPFKDDINKQIKGSVEARVVEDDRDWFKFKFKLF